MVESRQLKGIVISNPASSGVTQRMDWNAMEATAVGD